MNKSDYSGLSVLESSKKILYLIWYDYVIPKYDEKKKYVIWIEVVPVHT